MWQKLSNLILILKYVSYRIHVRREISKRLRDNCARLWVLSGTQEWFNGWKEEVVIADVQYSTRTARIPSHDDDVFFEEAQNRTKFIDGKTSSSRRLITTYSSFGWFDAVLLYCCTCARLEGYVLA